jgi:hypothetical protein
LRHICSDRVKIGPKQRRRIHVAKTKTRHAVLTVTGWVY